jgi:FKBP-type peptidyl-prolyl cis-trans isomerase FkpA
MKHFISLIMITLCLCMAFSGCDSAGKTGGSSVKPEDRISKDASYAYGMFIGTDLLKANNIFPDMKEFIKGVQDALYDAPTRFTMDEAYEVFIASMNEVQQRQEEANRALREEEYAENKQSETDFLIENSSKPGVQITGSGLQYEVITEGGGAKPDISDTVRVHYEGTLTDGTVFDSSYSRGEPVEFSLMGVIPGWTEGIQLMNVGSKYRFYIPSDLGYGPDGAPPQIPPYSALIFDVELLEILK